MIMISFDDGESRVDDECNDNDDQICPPPFPCLRLPICISSSHRLYPISVHSLSFSPFVFPPSTLAVVDAYRVESAAHSTMPYLLCFCLHHR